MGDVGLAAPGLLVAALGQEAVVRQVLQDLRELDRVVAGAELRDGLLAAGVGPALAELDQAEEDPAGDLGPGRALERRDDRVGVLGDRHLEAGALALAIGDRVGRPREDQRLVGRRGSTRRSSFSQSRTRVSCTSGSTPGEPAASAARRSTRADST